MGCNCGKPKPAPHGKPSSSSNGGGLAGQTQGFSLSSKPGAKFGSMLEAQAAAIRAGGGTIKPL